jgi:hypothetical protein
MLLQIIMKDSETEKGYKRKTNAEVVVSPTIDPSLVTDIRDLITSARRQMAQTVNAGLTMLYWGD